MKILLNIPDDVICRLDDIAHNKNIPRSELIRSIINNYLSYKKPTINRLHKDKFGKFAGNFDPGVDSLNIQSELRKEWSE